MAALSSLQGIELYIIVQYECHGGLGAKMCIMLSTTSWSESGWGPLLHFIPLSHCPHFPFCHTTQLKENVPEKTVLKNGRYPRLP